MLFHQIPHSLGVTLPPAAEPLLAADLHSQLRVDDTNEDTLLNDYISTAREMVELDTRRALVTHTKTLYADQFANWGRLDNSTGQRTNQSQGLGVFYGGEIEIPCCPIPVINSIKYLDADGTLQTLDSTLYLTDLITEPPRLFPAYGQAWPITRWQANAVQIEFVTGYATPFTANSTTDVITLSGRTVANGDSFRLTNAGGALPAGLSANTNYYVINTTGSTCKLSLTSGGSAVDITGAGTGTQFLGTIPKRAIQAIRLLVSHWHRHRETVGTVAAEVAFTYTRLIRSLLWTLPT